MKISFREQAVFSKVREQLFGDDEGYRRFQNLLLIDPRFGDVIPGAGGARKVRWSDARRGKGKRSGVRIIYLYVEEYGTILLMFGYDKNISDLTPQQKRALVEICGNFRVELQSEASTQKLE